MTALKQTKRLLFLSTNMAAVISAVNQQFSNLGPVVVCENRRFFSLIADGGRFAIRNVCDSATKLPY